MYPDWKSSQVAAPTDYAPITQVATKLVQYTDPTNGQYVVDQNIGDLTGMLLRNTVCTLKQVTDGTSHTIMLAESAGRPYVFRKGARVGDLTTNRINGGGWCRPASEFSLYGSSTDGVTFPGTCAINCANGDDYLRGGTSDMSIVPLTLSGIAYGTDGTGATFAFHPGGANLLMGDGSVQFTADTINIRVYARLVTRKGAEVINPADLP
jgi:prepilin-type processing-associated H-X9-DG protein